MTADEAAEDAGGGVKDVGDDVAVAAVRGVKEASSSHLDLLHHLGIFRLLSLLLEAH